MYYDCRGHFFLSLLTLILASMLLCHLPSCLFTVNEFLSLSSVFHNGLHSACVPQKILVTLFFFSLTFKFPLFVAQAIFVSYYTIYHHISSKHASNTSFPWFPNVLFSYLLNDQSKQQDNDSDLICSFPAIREKREFSYIFTFLSKVFFISKILFNDSLLLIKSLRRGTQNYPFIV